MNFYVMQRLSHEEDRIQAKIKSDLIASKRLYYQILILLIFFLLYTSSATRVRGRRLFESLLHLRPNVITVRTLSQLGQNVITFRVVYNIQALHYSPFNKNYETKFFKQYSRYCYLQSGSSCTGFPSIFNVFNLLQP